MTIVDIGLPPWPQGPHPQIQAEGQTGHYVGDSPWGPADRTSWERFLASTNHARCATMWRGIDDFHRRVRGWNGVAYNLCTCPHGVTYLGRGRGRRSAANGSNVGNSRSHAHLYLAGGADPLTLPAMIAMLNTVTEYGRIRWPHDAWVPTSCPGSSYRLWILEGTPHPHVTIPSEPEDDLMRYVHVRLHPSQAENGHREWLIPPGGDKFLVTDPALVTAFRNAGILEDKTVDLVGSESASRNFRQNHP